MKSALRVLKTGLYLCVAGCLGFLILFAGYGFSQGFSVSSGLFHLFKPHPPAVASNVELEDISWHRVSWLGDIENKDLDESSGLAASILHKNVLWSINDSGSEPYIYAMGTDGSDLGRWTVPVEKMIDWEAMDAFQLDGKAYLVIGDIGDNFRWRPQLSFVVVEEPADIAEPGTATIAWQGSYSYPDGYRDSEALAVVPEEGALYVVSKRRYPPELFRLSIRESEHQIAKFIVELDGIPQPTQAELDEDDNAHYRHMPSGMDIAGPNLLITTYKHAYVFNKDELSEMPVRLSMPSVGQRESIAFANTEKCTAYVTRERPEGRGIADIFMIEMRLDQKGASQWRETPQVGHPACQ